jgi:phosphatidylserine/phosphatidylglycerophosphate/cardiolipin synthase-like enzyme
MKISKPSFRFAISLAVIASTLGAVNPAFAGRHKSLIDSMIESIENGHSFQVPAAGTIEVAFSPNEGSESLVVKVIDSAHRELRVLAYSFTSVPVVDALLRAKKRGVDVRVVADEKSNVAEDHSGKARAAFSALVNAGVDVRTIRAYPIHHDKVICVDAETVELGSYNFSAAAAHKNSENVFVNWHNPQLAKVYLEHFERNYRQSIPYTLRY